MQHDKIIFVCTGNTCRSPMAEMLMKKKLREAGADPMPIVVSRGLNASNGAPISDPARTVLAARGVTCEGFISLMLREQDFTGGRVLILAMTRRHAEAVKSYYRSEIASMNRQGAQNCEVFTLAEYVGEARDVADPFGQPVYVYADCCDQIERLLSRVIERECIG